MFPTQINKNIERTCTKCDKKNPSMKPKLTIMGHQIFIITENVTTENLTDLVK